MGLVQRETQRNPYWNIGINKMLHARGDETAAEKSGKTYA